MLYIRSDVSCSSSSPCGQCTGECGSDSDCAGDLVCFHRSGTEPVPGCRGEGTSGYDYCATARHTLYPSLRPTLLPSSLPTFLPTGTPPPTPPDSTTLTGDSRHFCSSSRPCGKCYGDCDDDSECAGELICYNRQNFDPVPGCSDFGTLGFDYCTIPPSDSNTDERPRFASGSKESLSVLAAIGVAVLAVILGGCC